MSGHDLYAELERVAAEYAAVPDAYKPVMTNPQRCYPVSSGTVQLALCPGWSGAGPQDRCALHVEQHVRHRTDERGLIRECNLMEQDS